MLACSIRCFEHLVVSNRSGLFQVAFLIPNQDRVYRRFDSERLKQKARGSCEMPSDADFADVKNDYPAVVVEDT